MIKFKGVMTQVQLSYAGLRQLCSFRDLRRIHGQLENEGELRLVVECNLSGGG